MKIKMKSHLKLNNKGFSLIEVLVTIAIIAIITIPVLRSFIMSASINQNASRLQNATALAQGIAEEFKAMTLTEITEIYGEPEKEKDEDDRETGRLIFKNLGTGTNLIEYDGKKYNYYKGAGGEDFFVDVVLNPNDYKDVVGINDYAFPSLQDLYDNDVHGPIVIKSDIVKFDSYLLTGLGITKDKLSEVVKTTNIRIETSFVKEAADKYYYMDCYLSVEYEYNGKTYRPEEKLIETYTLSYDEEVPPVYICYNTFDIYSKTLIMGSYTYGASDKVNIYYSYTGDKDEEREVKFYLAQQKTKHSESTEAAPMYSSLKWENVSFSEAAKLNIYTNLENWEGHQLTSGDKTADALYKMTVTVKYKAPDGNVITTIDCTKES